MKTLHFLVLSTALIFASCQNYDNPVQLPPEVNSHSSNSEVPIKSSDSGQPSNVNLPKKDSIYPIHPIAHIDSFLLKPFDLYKFKRKTFSNSGGATKHAYYYKPEYRGFYYAFFLFSNLRGYYGHDKDQIIQKEDGLYIATYKPFGKYRDDYVDPNEELIEVRASFNHHDLPELAFIGLDTTEINQILGKKSSFKNNCFVYSYQDRVLILGITGETISWLKYLHLNSSFENLIEQKNLFIHNSY